MKKPLVCLFIAVMCFIYLLSRIDTGKAEIKTKDGIKHVYNPADPAKGKVVLNLKKHLTIDPAKDEAGSDDLFFTDHALDKDGNIFLLDGKSVRIHKFSSSGKYIKSFSNKGEGPGEFDTYPKIQVFGSYIYIFGRHQKKIARYTTGGTFLREFKLRRFYHEMHMIDNERFIASVYNDLGTKGTHFIKYLSIYTLKEQNTIKLFEAENAGRFIVHFGNTFRAVIPGPAIYKDIVYAFDANREKIYISFNKDYKIFVKNLEGKTERGGLESSHENKISTHSSTESVIHKEHNNSILKHSDKVDLVNTFGSAPEIARKAVIDALPDKMCAIESMDVLANGCLLVRIVTGYRKFRFDIFSQKGEYVYSIALPEGINLDQIKFYKGVLSGIKNREDTPVYHIYKIESLPQVF